MEQAAAKDMAEQAAQLEALWKAMGADPATMQQLLRVIQESVE